MTRAISRPNVDPTFQGFDGTFGDLGIRVNVFCIFTNIQIIIIMNHYNQESKL